MITNKDLINYIIYYNLVINQDYNIGIFLIIFELKII